jgi:hypothetical protein
MFLSTYLTFAQYFYFYAPCLQIPYHHLRCVFNVMQSQTNQEDA